MIYCEKSVNGQVRTTAVFLQMKLLICIEDLILKVSFSISKGHFYAWFQGSSVAMVQTTDNKLVFCYAS